MHGVSIVQQPARACLDNLGQHETWQWATGNGQWATAAPLVTCDCDIVALPGTRSPALAGCVIPARGEGEWSGQLFIVISAVYIQSKHSAPGGRGLRRERGESA